MCAVLAGASVIWAVVSGLGGADWLWVEVGGAPPSPIWRVTEGIQAGTAAGKWTMLAIAATVLRRRDLALLLGLEVVAEVLLFWRAGLGASMLSIVPALLVLGRLAIDRAGPAARPRSGEASRGPVRWLMLACGFFVALGALIVFDFHGPAFASYLDALHGLDPSPSWPGVELAYGRIAVGFSVHYGALALVLHRRGADAALLRGAMLAQLAWVLPDSIACLAHGAAFNVVQINLPAMVAFTAAWALTRRRAGS